MDLSVYVTQFVVQFGALILYLVPLFSGIGLLFIFKQAAKKHRINPLLGDLLRPAGFSLQQKIDDQQWEVMKYCCGLPMVATIAPFSVLVEEKLVGVHISTTSWIFISLLSLIGVIYFIYKMISAAMELPKLRLGLACEMAVAQSLEHVIYPEQTQCRVFHDIQFEGFNIDHLVVLANGVFVIETKGRSKYLLEGKKQAKVTVEGGALKFPTHTETQPLEQVRMNIRAVKQWLDNATGLSVPVAGVLVLPGWYVELKERTADPYVMNDKGLSKNLASLRNGYLDPAQMKAIVYQAEQKCRTIDRHSVK
ncbi:nuclease-related domain-containing protein [Pokkaliibacter sp. CJK22405]|uniref:nuclease-related domain-containing protein n=1 Tax=Pokkaliibacter sp. CJK22405 TaxID=3384615 RepID=UPI0039850C52